MIKAVSPFASADSGAVSKDGTIAYSSVSWNVNPTSLDTAYLSRLDKAVAPARQAACSRVRRRGRADRPGDPRPEVRGHRPDLCPGAAAVHVRLADRRRDPAGVGDLQRRRRALAARRARGRGHLPDQRADHCHPAGPGRSGGLRAVPGGQASRAAGRRHGRGRFGGARRGNVRRGYRGGRHHRGRFDSWAFSRRGCLRRLAGPGRGHRRRHHDAGRADPGPRVHGGGQGKRPVADGANPRPASRDVRAGAGRADRGRPRSSTSTARSPAGAGR